MYGLLSPGDLLIVIAAATPVAIVLGAAITLYRPRVGLLACCMLLLLAGTKFRARDAQALIGGDIDGQVIYELALFSTVAVIAVRNALRYRPSWFRPVGMEMLLGGYVALALLSVLWATHLNITAVRSLQLAILFAFSVISVRILGPQGLLRALMVSVISYVLVLATMVLLFPGFAAGRHWWVEPARFAWFGVHPLMVAMYAGSALILLLAFALFGARERQPYLFRDAAVGMVILALAAVVGATRSRAALLAISAAILVLLVRKFLVGPGASRSRLSMALVFAWGGVVVAFFVQQLVRADPTASRLGSFFMRGQSVEALRGLNGRDLIWAEVVTLFSEQPLVGYGYLASRVLLLEKIPWAGDGHFALAESLMNVGGLGTALIFIPLVYLLVSGTYFLFRSTDSELKYRAAVVAGTVFIVINSMSTPGFAGPPTYEVLIFFIFVLVNGHLNLAYFRRSRVRPAFACRSWAFAPTRPRVEA
jgi:O-antigen ligase